MCKCNVLHNSFSSQREDRPHYRFRCNSEYKISHGDIVGAVLYANYIDCQYIHDANISNISTM